MNEGRPDDPAQPTPPPAHSPPTEGSSPYATGGGGTTFERKVAVQCLAHMLAGTRVAEVAGARRVVRVAFQQAPQEPADDLVLHTALPDEPAPSLVIALAVRRAPNLVESDRDSRKLVRQLVQAVPADSSAGSAHRVGLVVAGTHTHAEQLSRLADIAAKHPDAPRFFDLVTTPGKFDAALRRRLDHFSSLVRHALEELDASSPAQSLVQRRAWQVLSNLVVLMPRLEAPDFTDWTRVVDSLTAVVPDADPAVASALRERLVGLANDYAPGAAVVDLENLRRDVHDLLDTAQRRRRRGWATLGGIHDRACDLVRASVTGRDGRTARLDRTDVAARLRDAVSSVDAVTVSGESGVGKSALAVLSFAAAHPQPDGSQSLAMNLRQLPVDVLSLETALGDPLSVLLAELSAPQRTLVVDGAEAAAEDREGVFRYLLSAARDSDVKMIAVTTADGRERVLDILAQHFDTPAVEFDVPPLTDPEIEQLLATFPELKRLFANPRSRALLRRLVVVDLLVRGGVSGTPLTDAEAMEEIWTGLVKRPGQPDRGRPVAREAVMLKLAEVELGARGRLDVVAGLDADALDGLQRDGLLRSSADDPFAVGPEFAHDELRRYALARLLLNYRDPASKLLQAGAPRWALAAARLACQALLARPRSATFPLQGRLSAQQTSFDRLVEAGHGPRWGDVPGEALLALPDYDALLEDAWPQLIADDEAGLQRIARLVDQRLRDDAGVVDANAVSPIIAKLLETATPWRSGEYATDLLRDWLRALAIARTPSGHALRIRLRQRLVAWCAAADRDVPAQRDDDPRKNTPDNARQGLLERLSRNSEARRSEEGTCSRRRSQELRNSTVVELLALLGPDLGDDGTAILARLARNAPAFLAPAVDELVTAWALASGPPGLLGVLTEAYYLDDTYAGLGFPHDGIRGHGFAGLRAPHAAWYRGPFTPLLRIDFRTGVQVLNRLLNHAAHVRAATLNDIDERAPWRTETAGRYASELVLDGKRRRYVGDEHVWRWYRGGAVGPDPCISGLQALERECERLLAVGVPIGDLIPMLLDGCENLAIPGLIVGMLVRHAEDVDNLLDPYLTEPLVWHLEFVRASRESSPMATRTEGLAKQERRQWSLREAAMILVGRATGKRIDQLRSLGKALVGNARRLARGAKRRGTPRSPVAVELDVEVLPARARAWASTLDRDTYQGQQTDDGVVVESTPPADVAAALELDRQVAAGATEAIRLFHTYHVGPSLHGPQGIAANELVADLATARGLLENPPARSPHHPLDLTALVAAAALEAHVLGAQTLPDDALLFASEVLLQVAEQAAGRRDANDMLYGYGADRTAAKALPLLFLPAAQDLRTLVDPNDDSAMFDRTVRAGLDLARIPSYEVHLHLARGLDQLWRTPCADHGRCHHQAGWDVTVETVRGCSLGPFDPETGTRSTSRLEDPLAESLAQTADDAVIVSRLDGAIRALGPAAAAGICVSAAARELLSALFATQRRSLLASDDPAPDDRGTHSLVAARALLELAADGDERSIVEYIDAYADNSALIDNLLRALSAAGEETPDRAATAQRVWPDVVWRVLQLNDEGRRPFADTHYGEMALTSLIPVTTGEIPYLYREVDAEPITWWNPESWRAEVDAWLVPAAGNGMCANQLVWFLDHLPPESQVGLALPWMERLVLADPGGVAQRAVALPRWLIEMRPVAIHAGVSDTWQAIVDALVVAGVRQLAPYSD